MEKKKNVPVLRFPEFSGEWEQKKLKELTTLITKGTTPSEFTVSGIKFVKLECFINDEINNEKCLFINEQTHNKELRRSILREGDILFAIAGATIGKCNIVSKKNLPANTNQALSIIRLKEDENNLFVYHNLKSNKMQRYIIDSISVGAQPNLNLEQMGNFSFSLPNLNEQQEIATFISTVDKKLQTLKKKKTLLEQYKKGMMQKIFSQELRFKDDKDNSFPKWGLFKLGDLLSVTIDNRGKTPPVLTKGIYLLEVNSIGKKEINYNVVTKFVNDDTYNNWFRKYLEKGDILFSTVGNTALCSYYDGKYKACIAQNIVGLRFKKELGLFMFYLLTEEKNNYKFKQIEMGAVQPSVKVSQMVDLYFKIPNFEEQTTIANFLSAIDEKINLCNTQIEKTEQWKKGLLQKMFV